MQLKYKDSSFLDAGIIVLGMKVFYHKFKGSC
jgi:hypothetical protein